MADQQMHTYSVHLYHSSEVGFHLDLSLRLCA